MSENKNSKTSIRIYVDGTDMGVFTGRYAVEFIRSNESRGRLVEIGR